MQLSVKFSRWTLSVCLYVCKLLPLAASDLDPASSHEQNNEHTLGGVLFCIGCLARRKSSPEDTQMHSVSLKVAFERKLLPH